MSDENKALIRRFNEEVWNNKNLDTIDELMTDDVVDHEIPPELPLGADGVRAFIGMYMSTFPDVSITIDNQVASHINNMAGENRLPERTARCEGLSLLTVHCDDLPQLPQR